MVEQKKSHSYNAFYIGITIKKLDYNQPKKVHYLIENA